MGLTAVGVGDRVAEGWQGWVGGWIPVLQVQCVPVKGQWGQQKVAGEGTEPPEPLQRQRNRRLADKM